MAATLDSEAARMWASLLVRGAESRLNDQAPSGGPICAGLLHSVLESAYDLLSQFLRGRPGSLDDSIREIQRRHPLTPHLLIEIHRRVLDHQPVRREGRILLEEQAGARKGTGSYFTPAPLIERLLDATLAPTLACRIAREVFGVEDDPPTIPPIEEWSATLRKAAEKALLTMRVCDPACGPGGFLLAAGDFLVERLLLIRHSDRDPSEADRLDAKAEVMAKCLHGADLSALAIRVARLALWLDAGKPDREEEAVVPSLRVGNSLFDLYRARSDRFDVVIGNPPFANAIEGLVDRTMKQRLVKSYPELVGTADLAFYFLALADRLADPDGAVGLLLPRGVLTGRSTFELRKRLLRDRPPAMIFAPRAENLFAGADVFVVLLALRKGAICLGGREIDGRFESLRIDGENWWAPLVATADTERLDASGQVRTVGDRFDVFASMTTGMAYDLKPYLRDEPRKGALKLVTTGLIDPGVCHWGQRTCRYLKSKYASPHVHEAPDMPAHLATRLEKVRRPKVLVAGLSVGIEAFIDAKGIYCGAVSTYSIVHPRDDLAELARLCDHLNGPEATRRLQLELGANAMSGGRITLNKHFLRRLPYS